ncbi:uncharacterized protein LOC131613635 [Vicia villosa]|uniref:uncharacterized protein LOC131613635 n=1 Tax=Vicia villosa TaxID=3911 RepID=UPI00273C4E9A|nr:uncharacterized protein LOC131613635 [Vicia villosa]
MTAESIHLARITAYLAETKLKATLEADLDENMALEAMLTNEGTQSNKKLDSEFERFDGIYDDEPFGFEKDPDEPHRRIKAQDPLEEIDLGENSLRRPTYMPGLSRTVVKHQLPLKLGQKPVKQAPRRFAPEVMAKIKVEIERLLKSKFIQTARYVEWLANIVPVIKKNGTLRVCIDFRDLNRATPKDEYPMPVAEMLVDSAVGLKYLSMLDGYSGYNQIFIAEEDIPKTAFRCPGALGTYEWVVMPFGLKNAGDFLGFVVHKKGIEINKNKTKAILELQAPDTKKQLQSLLGKVNFLRRFISNLSGKTKLFSSLLKLKNNDVFKWEEEHQHAFDQIKAYLTKPPILIPPNRTKSMKLYIAVSDSIIGSMLAQKDDHGVERAIYYLSRILVDAETRYSDIEKLCLCLYYSCNKLKQYMKPVDVYVSSHFDIIKHMLSKPILHSRIGKWALALTEFSLTYVPLKAMKGQIVADFIVDQGLTDVSINMVTQTTWQLYFDGSSHRNGSGIGVLIISPQGIPSTFKYKISEACSNNEVEYEALITGLRALLDLGATEVQIKGDSELVIRQITKEYKCIKENLIIYYALVILLLDKFHVVHINHVPRIENSGANKLAQISSGYRVSKYRLGELIEIKEKEVERHYPALSIAKIRGKCERKNEGLETHESGEIFEFEIFAIDNMTHADWRKPLIQYLNIPVGVTDRKIKYRALSYVMLGNELYKKTAEGVLMKCLSEAEAFIVVPEVHSGACGAHQSGHKMKWLLFRRGLYWPSMLKDCIEFAKGFQECQKFSGIQHVPASELHAIVKPWPFRGWALDLIGEIKSASSKQQKYILVGIDYFTKWIEVIPLVSVNQESVIDFIQKFIIFRYGIPVYGDFR